MNQDGNRKGDFEDRLLAQLRTIVADREPERGAEPTSAAPAWRRGPRLVVAGGAVAAVAATVLVVGAGGKDTPSAYAVTPGDDGNVSVEIRSLGDPEGLAAALDDAGVPAEVEYVPTEAAMPAEAACEISSADAATGMAATVEEAVPTEPARLTVHPGDVGPGETLKLTAAPAGDGIAVETEVAETEPMVAGEEAEADESVPAEDDAKGAEDEAAAATCGASVEGTEAVPTVPAEAAGEPGAPVEEADAPGAAASH